MTPAIPPGRRKALPSALAQGDGILIVDADLTIIQANAQLQALFCATQEELLGADAPGAIRRYLGPLLTEGESPGEVVALLRDGSCPSPVTLDVRVPGTGARRVSISVSTVDAVTPALRLLVFHDTGEGGAGLTRYAPGEAPLAAFARDRDLPSTRAGNPEDPGLPPVPNARSTDSDLFCPEDATCLRQTIEALARSERHLATLMSNLPGMAYRCRPDPGRTMEFVSEGALSLTGYTPEEIVGNRRIAYGDLIHPGDRRRVREEVVSGLAEGRPFQLVYRLIAASGAERWVREQGRGTPGSGGGAATAVEGYITDITDRVQAEEDLAESEDRFRSIFSTSHAVMLIVDPETSAIVDANPAASAYYGYPLETLTAMRIADINALGEEELLRDMQKAVTSEEQHFSFLHRLADGRCRDVDVFSGCVVIRGRVLLHSIIHDVTGRRRAEEQFRALLDATPDAAMLIDHDGTLLALNEVMAARFEKTVGEILGTCAYDLLPPELAVKRRELTAQALIAGSPLRHVDERDGRILENVLFPVPGGREDGRRVAVISHDITRERELERVRQEAFDRIRQNIEQFAILGDHIRQPLQVILGTACLLEDEQATRRIQQEVGRINGYIRQLDQGWIDSRKIQEYLRRYEWM